VTATQPQRPHRRRHRRGGEHRLVPIDDQQARLLDQVTALHEQTRWEENPE
jgi:hypothetical protein